MSKPQRVKKDLKYGDDGIQKAIRFPNWLHDEIQADATDKEMSFAAWVRIVCKKHLVRHAQK